MKYTIIVDGREISVEFEENLKISELKKILINGEEREINLSPDLSSVLIGGKSNQVKSFFVIDGRPTRVEVEDHVFGIEFKDEAGKKQKPGKGSGSIHSPLQGVVSSISAKLGHIVHDKDVLLTIESMKMQNEIRSDVTGIVKNIAVKTGDTVKERDLLIEIDPEAPEV